jgi:hypothetical protein
MTHTLLHSQCVIQNDVVHLFYLCGRYGMDVSDLDVGKQMMWRGFNSCSVSDRAARKFAQHGPHPILYIIHDLRPYASAKFKLISHFPSEEEVVLRPGVVFEVVSRSQTHGCDTVTLQFKGTLPQAIQRYRWEVNRSVEFSQWGTIDVDMVATDAADAAKMWCGSEQELLRGGGVVWAEPVRVAEGACALVGQVTQVTGV